MATASNAPPVDVKAAVRIARTYFDQLLQHPYSDLAVEEVERSDDGRYWQVTLGYTLADPSFPTFMTNKPRDFKLITIDANSGEPTSMKVKKL
jgi:hypothetical protein